MHPDAPIHDERKWPKDAFTFKFDPPKWFNKPWHYFLDDETPSFGNSVASNTELDANTRKFDANNELVRDSDCAW
jgi:hypothetical protein